MLVEEAASAERFGQPFPLTIVFVERKVELVKLSYVDFMDLFYFSFFLGHSIFVMW